MSATADGRGYTRTELVWPGKRKQVDKVALPFQRVESINRPRGADMFSGLAEADGWRNKLIWGDNKLVMGSLLAGDPSSGIASLAGKIDLIYIDPPFDTGADFSFRTQIGDEECAKAPSIIEQTAYRDAWGQGTSSYLQMMYDRLNLMRELLCTGGGVFSFMSVLTSRISSVQAWTRCSAPSATLIRLSGSDRQHTVISDKVPSI